MATPDCIQIPLTPGYTARIAREFQHARRDAELTDFSIQSGARSYNCHKVILSANSPVLKALLRSSMTEDSSEQVDFANISPDVMEVLLDYMYTGQVSIPHQLLLSTVESSDFLQMLELKELCLRQAVKVFKPSQAISWFRLAHQLNVEELKSKCSEMLSSSLAEIAKYSEFLELSTKEINGFISDIQEYGTDPDDVLEATLGWVEHKRERVDHLENLLQSVTLSGCSLECLEEQMQRHRTLLKYIPKAAELLAKLSKQSGVRARHKTTRHIVLGGQNVSINKMVWELNQALEFVEICEYPEELSIMSGVCGVPGGFVLTGGNGSVQCSRCDLVTQSWNPLPPLQKGRFRHGSVFANGRIFVFGGRIAGKVSQSVQSLKLDGTTCTIKNCVEGKKPKTDEEQESGGEQRTEEAQRADGYQWTDEPDLPHAMCCAESLCVDTDIFLLDIHDDELWFLEGTSDLWIKRAKAPVNCYGARMISVQDKLMVGGGNGRIYASYDPILDTWTTLSQPSLRHEFGALVQKGRKVYLMGGYGQDGVEEYDSNSAMWSVCECKVPRGLNNMIALNMGHG